jgi:hypothetical protein
MVNGTLLNFGKRYKVNLRVIFDEWPKLHLGLGELTHWHLELYSSSNHISPLLNRPQGCQGCQKNRKDLRITTMIRFCASFQPKLNELHKKLQNQQKLSKYAGFLVMF